MVIGSGMTLLGHDGHGKRVAKGPVAETATENPKINQGDLLAAKEDLILAVRRWVRRWRGEQRWEKDNMGKRACSLALWMKEIRSESPEGDAENIW
jgi:hypothetical protein